MEINIDLDTSNRKEVENLKGLKYFGFIDEGILGKAIQDNQTAETIEKVVETITEKIKQKLALNDR
ncbi:20249_t:CDS:2 [Gigaspora margarita]|uniref:20249_t:CDS:1 n=1 Tax=Gigaspora margarita TaxID=4874 RepID=A0ABN7WSW9_GIGMA|nr:20249_t:CDS:2 [Gigaspora margarita]